MCIFQPGIPDGLCKIGKENESVIFIAVVPFKATFVTANPLV